MTKSCDSGPGGLAAGAATTLVKRCGWFGGNISAIGVEGFACFGTMRPLKPVGSAASSKTGPRPWVRPCRRASLSYERDSEGLRRVADCLLEEAGIHPMLHRQFASAVMDGDTIRGIVVESKAGREAILAQWVSPTAQVTPMSTTGPALRP